MSLERYRSVIPDWTRLRKMTAQPEPTYLRVRTGRAEVGEVRTRLEAQGFVLDTVEGLQGLLRIVNEPYSPGQTLEHWLGLFYIQQAVTAVAALALDPRAGERVLDACAAPGGKTTHLSDLMDDQGTVVSVDLNEKRLRGLLGNVYRTGHLNVLAMSADARHLPKGVLFDRVLVDAPCTAEGNLRSRAGELPSPDCSFREHIAGVQEEILRRAVDLTRDGGTILYATCTFAPEENEAVVSRVVEDGLVRVEPIALDIPHAPGLTRFQGESFDPSLEQAWRLYPHHLDSGGLFLARLRRTHGQGSTVGWGPVPLVFPGDDTLEEQALERTARGLELVSTEFGVAPEKLDHLRWLVRGKSVWAHRAEFFPVEWREARARRFLSLGVRAFKGRGRGRRPTNDFLRLLDGLVTRRRLELDASGCLELLLKQEAPAPEIPPGFVALGVDDRILGRGWVGSGKVRSEIPKARAAPLQDILEIRVEKARD